MTEPRPQTEPQRPQPRRQLPSNGAAGEALEAEVGATTETLAALREHGALLGADASAGIEATLQEVRRRLQKRQLSVVVVGERGAGKSTFLNAILGARLLGTAARQRATATFLRHGAIPGYRARMSRGPEIDFARSMPDRSGEIATRAAEAAETLAVAEARRAEAEARASQASEALARDDRALREAFRAFEAARDEATRVGDALSSAVGQTARAESAAAEQERSVPVSLRARPPWWAIWLWIARAFFAAVRWPLYRTYAARIREHAAAKREVARLAPRGSDAAQACRLAEAALTPLAASVEDGKAVLVEARAVLNRLAATRDQARTALDALEQEAERHVVERRRRFFADVEALSDLGARGKDVAELTIEYPARLLPDDVTIIDVPGVTDSSAEVQQAAWKVIREEADGCILVSELDRAVSESTKKFLQKVREVVPHILLVLTKMDEAFVRAMRKGEGEPWQHVDRARRIGTRRFAKEVGRDPSTVLSVAVAARPALEKEREKHGLARRFEGDVGKLFQLLRHERALILGARSAGAIRRCIAAIADKEGAAERGYEERISTLQADRIPDPEAFREQRMAALAPAIEEAASAVIGSAIEQLPDALRLLQVAAADRIRACATKAQLVALFPEIERTLHEGLGRIRRESLIHLEAGTNRAVRGLETGLFDDLQRLYRIAHTVERASDSVPRLEPLVGLETPQVPVVRGMERAVAFSTKLRVGLGVGGAATGAAIGTMIRPGIGTVVGAALGALSSFARGLGALRQSCALSVTAALGESEKGLADEVRAAEAPVAATIRGSLDRSLERAVVRYGQWIAEPIEAERAAIERESAKLDDLRRRREELQRHDERLAALMKAATEASIGLCG